MLCGREAAMVVKDVTGEMVSLRRTSRNVVGCVAKHLAHPGSEFFVALGQCSGSRFGVEFVSRYFRDLRGGACEVWS